MLPKSQRLTTKEIETLSEGKSVFGTLVSLRYRPSNKLKFAVAVSKKIVKEAVGRNRLRRIIYSAIGDIALDGIKPGMVMILPKKECIEASKENIKADIGILLAKTSL